MSLVPYFFNDFLDDFRRPVGELIDQHFGMGLSDDFFHRFPTRRSLLHMPLRSGYLRPWRHVMPIDSGVSSMTIDRNEFKVNLDVQQFKPEELKVSVDNGYLIVNGKHEERSDEHGYISREFTRRYRIPDDVDQSALASQLSSDGVLCLHAPKMVKEELRGTIEVPINQTNQPLRYKEDRKD